MKCPKCGADLPDVEMKGYGMASKETSDTRFEGRCCPNCGAPVWIISKGKVLKSE